MTRLITSLRRAGRLELALRTVIALDGSTVDHPHKLGQLLERQPGPEKFISAILGALRQGGVVDSNRGSRGGYWLNRPLAEITVLDVLAALGPIDAVRAVDGDAATVAVGSVDALWDAVDDRVGELLGAISLADLALPATAATA